MPTLRATAANGSLTLLAVGSSDTGKAVVGWRRWRWLTKNRSFRPPKNDGAFSGSRSICLAVTCCRTLALLAPGIGNVGDRVIAYLDHIGRVEGKITRIIDNGFAMTVGATARKRDKLAAQRTWLANRDILNLPEDRRHDRIVPRNPIALLTLEDGTKMTCRIIDMSLSGAAIAAENRPPLKSMVMLGKVQARVVRNLEEGFALEFVHEQMAEALEDSVTAR